MLMRMARYTAKETLSGKAYTCSRCKAVSSGVVSAARKVEGNVADRVTVERDETAVVQAAPDDAGDSAQGQLPWWHGVNPPLRTLSLAIRAKFKQPVQGGDNGDVSDRTRYAAVHARLAQ